MAKDWRRVCDAKSDQEESECCTAALVSSTFHTAFSTPSVLTCPKLRVFRDFDDDVDDGRQVSGSR